MDFTVDVPFGDADLEEVHLDRSPLVATIAQLRFPAITSIALPEFIGPFQEEIRDTYPLLQQEHEQAIELGPNGMNVRQQTAVLWRFSDVDESWRVTVGQNFLALDTRHYTSRTEFMDRLSRIVKALGEHVRPAVWDRLGIRYLNRLSGDLTESLGSFIRPEMAGVSGANLGRGTLQQALTTANFALSDCDMQGRWGLLPPGGTPDPWFMEPLDESTWLLDMDVFRAGNERFDSEAINAAARRFAAVAYRFFRWAVTTEFIEQARGTDVVAGSSG